ncbi:hypothetical protein IW261DRAFT_1391481 [Armillaria novae-zelandiae]|uniref:Rho termination factor N-terminal domain-containing protein n=1 Tax=Armillaria novae-zelandiae TaxID=153914 RepID=A0AA39UL19_9AGAR|nr:hypothetical protein IW261DRAFT_1391481 [Armillaria novae-zelandiae]
MQVVFTQDALKKLVVAQLKAICKERHLTGVWKLTKALLIQKILDHQQQQSGQDTPDVDTAPKQLSNQPSALSRDVSVLSGPSIPTQPSQPSLPLSLNLSFASQSQSQKQPLKAELPRRLVTQSKANSTPIHDRQIKTSTAPKILNKTSLLPNAIPNASLHSGVPPQPLTKKRPAPNEATQKSKKQKLPPKPIPFLVPPKSSAVSKEHAPKVATLTGTGKRFTPLIVNKPAPVPSKTLAAAPTTAYLDFPDFPPISLNSITLPPSMAQRRLVARIAIILSQVDEGDLKQCVLVSRMFRYAVYLSASQRIQRGFPGRRFALLLEAYPQNMTDMWPYLRLRNQEAAQRRRTYSASFLARVFSPNDTPISPRLWTSPDHEHQAKMAVRFLLTRLFFSVSVGDETRDWMAGTVVDAQQVVQGEIWRITMQQRAAQESFYVLEATCEVVGRPPSQLDTRPMRADWSAYVEERREGVREHGTLMEHVCWTNHEEYDRGISRHWLKRVRREGRVGAALEAIAGRYVLACVVGNSVSGRWKSSSEMAQDFSGASTSALPVKKERVNLFLPAHHHVESVHVGTAGGAPLHPALAVVQTPGREYFVLRDNGMQVGCEEEGVGGVWMRLLGCESSGRAC